MRIYVTGKWSNADSIRFVVKTLRDGLRDVEIYCFLEQEKAFAEEDILNEQDARAFYDNLKAIRESDVLVLVGPAGRGAYIEAGYAAGLGKSIIYYKHFSDNAPELMYGLFHVCSDTYAVVERLREYKKGLIYGTR